MIERTETDWPLTGETLEDLTKDCEQTGRTAEAQELSARAQRIRTLRWLTADR